jgi:putative Ca2+/H+ antiporter (TMEM165/GDT1 family)
MVLKERFQMQVDWRVFLSTFALVFLAELGDKTQLATVAMMARSRSPLAVFGGAALALVTITLVSVLVCEALLRVVPIVYVSRATGVLFILIGAMILLGQ